MVFDRKKYKKQYREDNKEKIKEYKKEYYQKNKEKNKEKQKEYYEKNKEQIKEYRKEYRQTDNGKKSHRISHWKRRGVISDDFDSLNEYYLNCENCEECDIKLIETQSYNGKCLDHDHTTGLFRNILCISCNSKRRW